MSELRRDGTWVSMRVDVTATLLTVRVRATGAPSPAEGSVDAPCAESVPPAMPWPAPVDVAAEVAGNVELKESLPLPAEVPTEELLQGGQAMDPKGRIIGISSMWRFTAGQSEACGIATAYEKALQAAGWERFTRQQPWLRTSHFLDPPRSVELEVEPDGGHTLLVSVIGAEVGTRQRPGGLEGFSAGGTPESRGEPVPCAF